MGGGCQSTVKKASIIDLTALVQSANERPELVPAATTEQKPIKIVITGPKSQETRIADWWSYLGDNQGPKSNTGRYFSRLGQGMGMTDRVVYTLETAHPLGLYVEQSLSGLLQSKGLRVAEDSVQSIVISLDEFWLDNTTSSVIRTTKISASVQVLDTQTQSSKYIRGVEIESSYSSDQSHVAVGLGGAVMASFVGVGPSGEGMERKADAEAAILSLHEALTKLQDELAADAELWYALQ